MKFTLAKGLGAALTVGLCAACTTPMMRSGGGLGGGDATYKVENRPNGFAISSTYSSDRFIPESPAAQAACKQSLMATAHDYAESFGRKIEPVNEQRIRIGMGRNGLTGMTSCEASVPVVWAR